MKSIKEAKQAAHKAGKNNKSFQNKVDYIAGIGFMLAGVYFFATQRISQGAIYFIIGIFFIVITMVRNK